MKAVRFTAEMPPARCSAGRARAGFTLIELLVVLVIFSLVSIMGYGGLNSVLKARSAVEASLERTAQLQKLYQRLREDFQLVRPRPVRDGFGELRAAVIGVREPRVEFTRGGWRNPLLLPRPGLERVQYRLDGDKLLRESFRVLDQAQDSRPVSVTLLDGVEALRLRYLNANREWTDQWPPPDSTGAQAGPQAPPPLAVEFTIETRRSGELVYLFRLGLDSVPGGFTLAPPGAGGGKVDEGGEETPSP
jgi:general secretion pathway protein J